MEIRHSTMLPPAINQRFSPYIDFDSRITDFRGKGMNEQILNIRLLIEKHYQYYKPMVLCFLEYMKDGKCVPWSRMIDLLVRKRLPERIACLIEHLARNGMIFGKDKYLKYHRFRRQKGVHSSQILSKSILDDHALIQLFDMIEDWDGGVELYGDKVKVIRFAHETTLVASNEQELALLLKRIEEVTINCGVKINRYTTKIMVVDRANVLKTCAELGDYERVNDIIYLGSVISNNGSCTKEIERRIRIASFAMTVIANLWKTKNIESLDTKREFIEKVVFHIFRYASETWTIKSQDRRKIDVFEMKCWRKMLGVRPTMRSNLLIRKQLNISKKLSTWCQLKSYGFFGHIVTDPTRQLEHALILCELRDYPNIRRYRGRPPKGWTSAIKHKMGFKKIRNVMKLAQYRESWDLLSHGVI